MGRLRPRRPRTPALADEFLASDHVVRLDSRSLPGSSQLAREDLFTTSEILDVQHRILDRFDAGRAGGAATVPTDEVERALDEHTTLTDEQARLVWSFCTSGNRVQCAIGRAGAGKTTTMRAAAAAWQSQGLRVLGTAVKGEATRHLAEGAGIPAETVAWFLARGDSSTLPLDSRTVLIVDEASTLSDRDLDTLMTLAERAGAVIRLVGDPDQHGAVLAGGMFRRLCDLYREETPDLVTSHRVIHSADRAAARALREGRTHEALEVLTAAGHLHVADNEIELYVGMLQRWWKARQHGADHPMVDRRHHTRRQLNRLARHLLRTHGELGEVEIAASGDRRFAQGDRVVARMAARHLHVIGDSARYVRNGAHGTVVDVRASEAGDSDLLHVDFTGVGVIEVPRSFFDEHAGPAGRRDVGLDHAYAVTSYAVQGATYDASTSRIDEGASRAETYVDITRGRRSNHLFVTRAPDPLDGEHLPKAPPPTVTDSVAERLRRSGPERAAVEFAIDDRPPARSVVTAPLSWTARFPEPNGGPVHLRRHWASALASVAAYRARWHPAPGHGDWEWAVGSAVADPRSVEERDETMDRLHRYAFALATEAVDAAGGATAPGVADLVGAMGRGADHELVVALHERLAAQCDPTSSPRPDAGEIARGTGIERN